MTDTTTRKPTNEGCLYTIAWFGAGFVLPFYSLEYYLSAMRKPLRRALLFFAVLMTLAAALTTARLSMTVESFRQQFAQAARETNLPVITIRDGEASVIGEDPFLVRDGERFFFAVDTTGALDRDQFLDYGGGILITRTTQYSYGGGRYQTVDLENYNIGLGSNPMVIDGEMIELMLDTLPVLIVIGAGAAVWIWNVVLWLFFLAISAYFLWGPIHQALPEFTYRAVLTIGIYAHLPALTISHIISLFGYQSMFIYTTLLLVFWVGTIYLVLNEIAAEVLRGRDDDLPQRPREQKEIQPPRLWPAWLGLPALVFISANAVYTWDFAPLYVLASLAATIGVLLFIDSRQHTQPKERRETE